MFLCQKTDAPNVHTCTSTAELGTRRFTMLIKFDKHLIHEVNSGTDWEFCSTDDEDFRYAMSAIVERLRWMRGDGFIPLFVSKREVTVVNI